MKEFYFLSGGFVGGFVSCWFFAVGLKTEILKLRTDIYGFLARFDQPTQVKKS